MCPKEGTMDQTQKAENPTIDMGGLSRVINLIYGYTTLSNRRLQQKGRNHVLVTHGHIIPATRVGIKSYSQNLQ